MMFHALAGAVRGSLSLALYIFEHRVLVHTFALLVVAKAAVPL